MTRSQAILLIDSDVLAAMTIGHALIRHDVPHPLTHVPSASEALLFLRHRCDQRPGLILADSRTIGSALTQTLSALGDDGELATIPVVVLGQGSPEHVDRLRQQQGVDDAILKATDYVELSDQIGHLIKCWTELGVAAVAA
jgi:CheY-like chemotaxis protein